MEKLNISILNNFMKKSSKNIHRKEFYSKKTEGQYLHLYTTEICQYESGCVRKLCVM